MKAQTQATCTPHKKSSLLAAVCALSLLALAPMAANADDKSAMDKKSMPMDHSKMDHSKIDHSKMDGMKHMEGMSMTGNVDYDFAANMKMHHQMGIDMAKAQIKNGKSPQMVKMAKAIVVGQTKESAAFDKYLMANKASMPDGMKMPANGSMPAGMSMPK